MNRTNQKKTDQKSTALGVQGRFLLGLALICFCFCGMITTLLYLNKKQSLEEETFNQTELVVAAIESTREYVRDVLRPRMYDLLDDETFVIEAMSTSYISRVVMDRFKEKLPDFEYRRVAINARNPDYEANALERSMIRYFREHPEESQWHGMVKINNRNYYMTFRPVRFRSSCMHCHGDVDDAPRAIVAQYGNTRGFFREQDVVSGVQSVGIPIDIGLLKIMDVAWTVFFAAVLAVFSLYGIIWFFFNRVVVQNLQELLDIFRDNLRDEQGAYLYRQARSKDEIEEMAEAVKVVAHHLRTTHKKLEDYAVNLEKKVTERTRALQESENQLRRKVIERGQELRILNTIAELITRSVNLDDILPRVLKQALKVIPAKGAGIYLLDREQAVLRLQCHENGDTLEQQIPFEASQCLPLLEEKSLDFDGFIHEAACTYMTMLGNEPALVRNINVPLCCRSQILGIMTFLGTDFQDVDAQQNELLSSIGHQVGITVESLQNISRLIQSKELLQTVFDGITDVVMLLDHENRVKMVNQAFLKRHRVTLEEVMNRPLDELPLKLPCPFVHCDSDISSPSYRPVMKQIQVEGGFIYEVSFYPIFYDDATVRNVVCYAKDITEQKQVERRIQQTEKLVALGQLAAGVAHEINNPLGIILCYTDILKEDPDAPAEQRRQDIEVIEKHARTCQRIVTDLLNFSRSQKTNKARCSINPIIEDVTAMVRQQFGKQQITITTTLADDLPELLLDRDRMVQVFLNLFMNSAHAISGEGQILVESMYLPARRQVCVIVEDDGQGIDAEILPKIFDPFFTTKPQGMGTGLGLSVSYGIIKDHDGEIQVESSPGEWTRFTITLPCYETLPEGDME